VISALSGAGGVGKTALALYWAHRCRQLFPDGQLYINLRGYERGQSVAPADALAGFLRALGVHGREIPDQLDQRVAMFRSLLDQRRMLVVLDNAASAEQVRPLLPGSGSSAVLVTSRNRLAGLVARDGAHRIELDALPLADAVGLLQDRIGAGVAAEQDVLESLAQQCMRLPLALRIAAELVASRPTRPLRAMVDELSDPGLALDSLSAADDQNAALRALFMSSYQNLAQDVAHAFRCLGLYPGDTFDAYPVAALTDSDLEQTRRRLDTLVHAHLIQAAEADRFRIHDLLRAFAVEQCRAELDDADRAAATTRLLDHYLSTTAQAMDYAYPEQSKRRPSIPAGRRPAAFADPATARAWLDDHRPLLCTLARFAGDNGFPQHLYKFAAVLAWYLMSCYFCEQAARLHANALRVARHASNRTEQAYAMLRLGRVHSRQNQLDQAFDLLRQALPLFRELAERWGEAQTLSVLGLISRRRGNINEDLDYQRQALNIMRELGDELGQALTLENIGFDLGYLGRYDEALPHYQAAVEMWGHVGGGWRQADALLQISDDYIHRGQYQAAQDYLAQATSIISTLHDPIAEAWLRYRLGCQAARQGRIEDSLAQHKRSMEVYRANNDRWGICSATDGLGMAYLAGARYREACEHFEIALAMTRESGHIIGLAGILNNLGEASTLGGDFDRGLAHHGEALELARQTGERLEQARALNGLAQAHLGAGHPHVARDYQTQSQAIFDDIGAQPGYGPRRQFY
jgi:tetratricopeptide (TPR) repeat protein